MELRIQEISCCGKVIDISSNKFAQQELRYYSPRYSPKCVLTLLFAAGVIFMVIGLLIWTSDSSEYVMQYANISNPAPSAALSVEFTPTSDMPAPTYIFYEAGPFFGGDRFFRDSVSQAQFLGEDVSPEELAEQCSPTTPCDGDVCDNPCGLVYAARFNDTFALRGPNGAVALDTSWQAISYPKEDRRYSDAWVAAPEFGHVANWMRVPATLFFRQTYARVDEDLHANMTYAVDIENNWPLTREGDDSAYKSVVVAKMGIVGTPNPFLAVSCVVVGAVFVAASVCLLILLCVFPASRRFDQFDPTVRASMGVRAPAAAAHMM
eukprot:gnl/Chilomastix_cuspidata/2492.p1 GENE.gnl/Chilomastix_cuspidata/2492~~gnl/Chilomastix_cuspidata/2492.p1  ORF type:complete len:322 (+),score=142.79 gnl/Chilomastix_cuspidata/2492:535-1500(+)